MSEKKRSKKIPQAKSPELMENQLINLAFKEAAKRLLDGTASSQLITHFLKLATVKEQLEIEKLRSDLRVADAKIENMQSQQDTKELFEKAVKAMKRYSGEEDEDGDDEY